MLNGTIRNLFDVSGKTALVTGGTSGIGLMITRALLAGGARVYVVARNEEACARVAAEESANGDCLALPGDLSSLAGIEKIAALLARREERLHILANNAGIMEQTAIDEYSEELWDRALSLNLKPVFFLTQKLLPLLRGAASADDPARVINTGSGHGLRISPFGHFGYTASKAGVHHLTRALAQYLASEHINVNAIAAGVFESGMTAGFSDELVAQITSGIPNGRFGRGDDIAGAVLYLSSRAGAYVNSTVLSVDGGWAGIS